MKYESIQFFRAVSAISVVIFHVNIYSLGHYNINYPIFREFFLGVDFFFTLSGFLILSIHYEDKIGKESLKNYLLKRIIRIFPPYIPVSTSYFIIFVFFPGIPYFKNGDFSFISSFFLIPSNSYTYLIVAWTLIHEMLFYGLFALFFVRKRIFFTVMAVWSAAVISNIVFPIGLSSNLMLFRFFGSINVEFIVGMIGALIWKKIRISTLFACFLFAFGIVTFLMTMQISTHGIRYVYSIPFCILIVAGCSLESSLNLRIPRLLSLLGESSYAIYLIHLPITSVFFKMYPLACKYLFNISHNLEQIIAMPAAVSISVVCGIIYHLYFERPVINFIRNKFLRSQ